MDKETRSGNTINLSTQIDDFSLTGEAREARRNDDVLHAELPECAEHKDIAREAVYSTAILDECDVDTSSAPTQDGVPIGDWIDQRAGSDVIDYEPRTECLMLVWDDTSNGSAEPAVDVIPSPENPDVMNVSMNGETVAEVHGNSGFSITDLTLIPLSSAVAIGLEDI